MDIADAATAFLQGQQPQDERSQPLYMWPPSDGLIAKTPHWKAKLYLIKSNIYGRASAPRFWRIEVTTRLLRLGYVQHSFDKMVFLKRDQSGHLVSNHQCLRGRRLGRLAQGLHNINEVHDSFVWGALNFFKLNEPLTFKGKEPTLKLNSRGRHVLVITQKEFIDGLDSGKFPKVPSSPSPSHQSSKVNFVQSWAVQSRPELSPSVSLNSLSSNNTFANLKSFYFALDFAKETSDSGLVLPDVPLNLATTLVSYADASWANSPGNLRSQFGVLVFATTPHVTSTPSLGDGSGRGSGPVPCRRMLHVVDAKSLYDSWIQENPQTTEKRCLVSIKSIQDSVETEAVHWVPTHLMRADGLTKISAELMDSLCRWLSAPWLVLREVKETDQY